jgi:hypothetical protein
MNHTIYKRRFKEELSKDNKEYLTSTVVEYIYSKNKEYVKDAKEFILKYSDSNEKEIEDYIAELIKTIPKPEVIYNKNKKQFENYFQVIKDIVGEDINKLYDLFHKNRIRKNKDIIKNFYDFIKESKISLDFIGVAYKKWYSDEESGSNLITKVNGYIIPNGVAEYCKLTNNVKDIKEWKARIRVANNGGKKGEYEDIGYLGISSDSILIPIARSDEHRAGYEYLWFLKKKGVIKDPSKFLTIFPLHESYFHLGYDADKEHQDLLDSNVACLKLWIKNTGWDIDLVSMARSWKGTATKFIKDFEGVSISDAFKIDANENISKKTSDIPIIKKKIELTKEGKRIIELFQEIWKRFKSKNDLVFNSVYVLLDILKPYLDNDIYMKFFEKIVQAEGTEDIYSIEDIVFGFFGIKNTIHNRLKSKDPKLKKLFGNLKLATIEFDKLGALK